MKSEETTDLKIETTIQQNIEVLVSATHSDIPFEESKSESLIDSENQVSDGMTSDLHNTIESKCVPPPPPPPSRPMMTRLTSTEAITLPNGEVLPAGTKQVVVHPYQTGDPYKFTADWFCDGFNAQNKTQTKS